MSQLAGVIRVHPNGLNGKCLVFVKDKDAVTEEKADEALRMGTKECRVRKMVKA